MMRMSIPSSFIATLTFLASLILLPTAGFPQAQEEPQSEGQADRAVQAGKQATDWVKQDLSRVGAWEYRIVSVQSSQMADVERELNELGKDRWEVFSIQQDAGTLHLFAKRVPQSYLKSLPMSDMLKLLPGFSGDKPAQ